MHGVTLLEEKFGQIGAILARDPGDQGRSTHEGLFVGTVEESDAGGRSGHARKHRGL